MFSAYLEVSADLSARLMVTQCNMRFMVVALLHSV